MTKRDAICVTAIGAEVGLLFQPIILNLWGSDIQPTLASFGLAIPAPVVHGAVFIGFTLLAPLALLILSFLSKFLPVLYQFGKFAAVGSSNSFVDLGMLNLIMLITGITKGSFQFAAIATGTAFAGTVNSFFWNKFWTFEAGKTGRQALIEAIKFYAVTGTVGVVNGALTSYFVNSVAHDGISDNLWASVSKVMAILLAMIFNFLGYKFFVFTPTPKGDRTDQAAR